MPIHSQGPSKQKSIKNLGEKGAWAYPETAQVFLSTPIISGTGKATHFKFGRYIHTVHPNKSTLKILEKTECGISWDCPNYLSTPVIISRTGKATNFKFSTHIHRIDRNKSPLEISAKVAVGVLRDSQKFSGHQFIRLIKRLSLWQLSFLVLQNNRCSKLSHELSSANGRYEQSNTVSQQNCLNFVILSGKLWFRNMSAYHFFWTLSVPPTE